MIVQIATHNPYPQRISLPEAEEADNLQALYQKICGLRLLEQGNWSSQQRQQCLFNVRAFLEFSVTRSPTEGTEWLVRIFDVAQKILLPLRVSKDVFIQKECRGVCTVLEQLKQQHRIEDLDKLALSRLQNKIQGSSEMFIQRLRWMQSPCQEEEEYTEICRWIDSFSCSDIIAKLKEWTQNSVILEDTRDKIRVLFLISIRKQTQVKPKDKSWMSLQMGMNLFLSTYCKHEGSDPELVRELGDLASEFKMGNRSIRRIPLQPKEMDGSVISK